MVADGTKAIVHISAPDRPLALAFKPDGSLDPEGSGPYQVHGRTIAGQNGNDDFTFAPREQTCELTPLMASNTIPSSVGMAAASGPAGNVAIPFANFRIFVWQAEPLQTRTSRESPNEGGASTKPNIYLHNAVVKTRLHGSLEL